MRQLTRHVRQSGHGRHLTSILAVPSTRFNIERASVNLSIKRTLHTLGPGHRYELARNLWHLSTQNPQSLQTRHKYLWVLYFIAPITRLPLELLPDIILIAIYAEIQSPLALMTVCRRWYNGVTCIWGSLDLRTSTSKDTITGRLEQNQLSLDIIIDT